LSKVGNCWRFSAQAATLSQTYTVNLDSQPLNSSTNVVLPKFNSLLGTLLKAYVTVKSTVNNSVSITPLTGDFTGTAATNANIAVNIPLLKVDPNLTLSVLASPPETKIANGGTEVVVVRLLVVCRRVMICHSF
jgi:hypothetical protein